MALNQNFEKTEVELNMNVNQKRSLCKIHQKAHFSNVQKKIPHENNKTDYPDPCHTSFICIGRISQVLPILPSFILKLFNCF